MEMLAVSSPRIIQQYLTLVGYLAPKPCMYSSEVLMNVMVAG